MQDMYWCTEKLQPAMLQRMKEKRTNHLRIIGRESWRKHTQLTWLRLPVLDIGITLHNVKIQRVSYMRVLHMCSVAIHT